MYENYFLASIPSEFEVCTTFHDDPYVEPSAEYYNVSLPCPAFTERTRAKVNFMQKICKENFGKIIVFADADLQFFGPFKKTLIEELGDLDMACQEDNLLSASRKLCGGLMVCRCNENTLGFLGKMQQHFRIDDQITLNDQKNACNHKTLPIEKFFTVGHVLGNRWSKEVNFSIPKDILVHHASWALGIEDKIKLLEIVRKRVHNRR
jgi:hypothetical protein